MSGDEVREAYPLFQEESGGAIPTSPLQLRILVVPIKKAIQLNRLWHSRLPVIVNWQSCDAYVAQFDGRYYAVAIWGPPIARLFNHRGYWELRRFAIAQDAPRNTASRMLGVMARLIYQTRPALVKLISYQDTNVHSGAIYRASGWHANGFRKGGHSWLQSARGKRNLSVALGDKIRWEKEL